MKYHGWTVLEKEGKVADKVLCECECGTIRKVNLCSLRAGTSKCCGCVKPDRTLPRIGKNHK